MSITVVTIRGDFIDLHPETQRAANWLYDYYRSQTIHLPSPSGIYRFPNRAKDPDVIELASQAGINCIL